MKIIYTVQTYAVYFGILSSPFSTEGYLQPGRWYSTSGTLDITVNGYLVFNIKNNTNDTTTVNPAEWDGTAKIILTSFNPRKLTKKYVAFGDSVTKGAVWHPSYEDRNLNPYTAAYEYQIPTRIAKTLGVENNFVNEGVSGIGYIKIPTSGDKNLVTLIKEYDFTNVELVTIGAGPNDASYPLGTSGSAINDGTICGAIRDIIDYMRENYPKIQLIFIQATPYVSYTATNENNVWFAKGSGPNYWSLNDFDR